MKTLVIFRRLEIWVLLIVIAALAVFALRTEPVPEEPETVEVAPVKVLPKKKKEVEVAETAEPVETGLVVEEVSVSGSQQGSAQQGKMIEVTLLGRSATDAEAPVTEATLTAQTDSGDPVNHFFEPFKKAQVFLPDEDSLVTVRLWLEQPEEFIWLDFQGKKIKTELPR